tara:strand:- start:13 stop:525 length:513 start_codon:yes stop_codon:yes gene_type:complete
MQLKETKEALNKFGKYVIKQARTNLSKRKMNVSGSLYNSLDYKMFKGANAIGINFMMDDYGRFQDKGVSGTKKKYNTPYSYTTKMPPPSAFSQWVVRKGLEGTRDKKTGRFLSRKSLQYAVAKNIFKYGIKPSMFFTKPFEAAFKRLPADLQNAFADDLDNSIIIPNNNK